MTRKSADPDRITIRPADKGDLEPLAEFRCSNGHWYEDETEKYIQESLPKLVENRHGDYHLLVTTDRSDRLLAVAGYRLEPIGTGDVVHILNRIDILALSLEQQGRTLQDGSKLSDVVLRALLSQALTTNDIDTFLAIVARENHSCIVVLERNADWTQVPHGGIQYLRFTARITVESKQP